MSNLYNSRLGRFRWFVKRFGASEVFFKPVRLALAPWIIPRLRPREFTFRGQTFPCFYAPYNMTWIGERMIEIPIIRAVIVQYSGRRVLEVGNVLSHYSPVAHEIIDKYETGHGVINVDVTQFRPPHRYDLIISISTFEHIGFDDASDSSSGGKILEAIRHCRGLLAPAGRLIITVPTGYNPELDELLSSGRLGAVRYDCLRRVQKRDWESCTLEEALNRPYRSVYPYANALVVAEFDRSA